MTPVDKDIGKVVVTDVEMKPEKPQEEEKVSTRETLRPKSKIVATPKITKSKAATPPPKVLKSKDKKKEKTKATPPIEKKEKAKKSEQKSKLTRSRAELNKEKPSSSKPKLQGKTRSKSKLKMSVKEDKKESKSLSKKPIQKSKTVKLRESSKSERSKSRVKPEAPKLSKKEPKSVVATPIPSVVEEIKTSIKPRGAKGKRMAKAENKVKESAASKASKPKAAKIIRFATERGRSSKGKSAPKVSLKRSASLKTPKKVRIISNQKRKIYCVNIAI